MSPEYDPHLLDNIDIIVLPEGGLQETIDSELAGH
jgi:hypothetical protein